MGEFMLPLVCDELLPYSRALSGYLQRAGNYVETDPRSSVVNMRFFLELTANYLLAFRGEIVAKRLELSAKIERVQPELPDDLCRIMRQIASSGNKAAHELDHEVTSSAAELLLQKAIRLARWFARYMRENLDRLPNAVRDKLGIGPRRPGDSRPDKSVSSTADQDRDRTSTLREQRIRANVNATPTPEKDEEGILEELSRIIEKIESSEKIKSKLPPKTLRRLKRFLSAVITAGVPGTESVLARTPVGAGFGTTGAGVIIGALGFLHSIEIMFRTEPESDDGHTRAAKIEIQKLGMLAAVLEPYKTIAVARQSALAYLAWVEIEAES